jgi:hypothetical protein
MTCSGGGMGMLFRKPVTWCVVRADRYTFELIMENRTYAMSCLPDKYMEQVLFLGNKSGMNSDKMKEVELVSIQTQSVNISLKEAGLIVECELMRITTPLIDDFCTQEAKDRLKNTYKQESDIRKYVFGEISHVWVKR